jgi:hypothetical protein
MKKQLQEVSPRSARAVAPAPPAITGAVMSLDDLPGNERSQIVAESLERAVLPQPKEEGAARNIEPTPAPAPVPVPVQASPATKMIATPIESQLRQRVRDLRGQFEISESFVVETALRTFFADRPLSEVAADLRARGGRLRRTR